MRRTVPAYESLLTAAWIATGVPGVIAAVQCHDCTNPRALLRGFETAAFVTLLGSIAVVTTMCAIAADTAKRELLQGAVAGVGHALTAPSQTA